MSSIYLVRLGDKWLHVAGGFAGFRPSMTGAMAYGDRRAADLTAGMWHAEPVEFREATGDTAAGALAAAEATIARLRDELEQLRNRPSTHELAKRFLEATE